MKTVYYKSERPIIVYIAGYPRSGSTLIDRILGGYARICGCGEIVLAWDYLLDPNALCTCHKNFRSCPLWSQVIEKFTPQVENEEFRKEWERLRIKYEGKGSLKRILLHSRSNQELLRYLDLTELFLSTLEEAARYNDYNVIIDSSKSGWDSLWRPLALQRLAKRDVRVIHLVRDVRGVMWSHFKGSNTMMEKGELGVGGIRFLRTLICWLQTNVALAILRFLMPRGHYIMVKYEDIVQNPKEIFRHIAHFLDMDPRKVIAHINASNNVQTGGHQVYGNRMRYQNTIRIIADLEWKEKLPMKYKLVGALFRFLTDIIT